MPACSLAKARNDVRDNRGGVRFLVDRKTLDQLTALRGPGESYSDVILRLARAEPIVLADGRP